MVHTQKNFTQQIFLAFPPDTAPFPPHFFVRVSMMATDGTSGVQGCPSWDRDEEKSNVHKMKKELKLGGGEFENSNLEGVNLIQ